MFDYVVIQVNLIIEVGEVYKNIPFSNLSSIQAILSSCIELKIVHNVHGYGLLPGSERSLIRVHE